MFSSFPFLFNLSRELKHAPGCTKNSRYLQNSNILFFVRMHEVENSDKYTELYLCNKYYEVSLY